MRNERIQNLKNQVMLRNLLKNSLKSLSTVSNSVQGTDAGTTLPFLAKMSETFIKKPKYNGRSKKRQWEERRSDKGETIVQKLPRKETPTENKPVTEQEPQVDRGKRHKYVMLMGYSGVGYYGMQRNPATRTIEEEYFKALWNSKYIDEISYLQVQNMQFQRAARTDKGVSAARQVVSLKLHDDFNIAEINTHLPDTIRIFGSRRVTKGFNSKQQCDSRTYIYLIPTIAFAPNSGQLQQAVYRTSSETIAKINDTLKLFEGTKNFHNFTAKKKASDPSAKRYIKSFVCEKPFVKNGVEFAVLKVQGQSFMLHQIRKMIGLVLAIVREKTTVETLHQALTLEKVNVPRAPGLGLVLDFVHYDRYNNRYGEDGVHEKLLWEEEESAVNEFKEKYIFPTIIETEIKEESMVCWLENKLSRHSYDDFDEEDDDDEKQEENSKETDS